MEQDPTKKPNEVKDEEGAPHPSEHSENTTSLKSQLIEYFVHGKWADPHVNKMLDEWKKSFMQKMYELDKNLSDQDVHNLFVNEQIKMLKEAKEKNEVPSGKEYIQSLIDYLYRSE